MTNSVLALPAPEDYVVSPGFAGVLIVVAAIVLFCAVLYSARRSAGRLSARLEQEDRLSQERRQDRDRAAVIDRCWQRLVWLVETAGTEPAAQYADEAILGLGPELALELLQGIHRDATEAGDETLSRAAAVYLTQYGLVLGNQAAGLPARPPGPAAPTAAKASAAQAAKVPVRKPPAAAGQPDAAGGGQAGVSKGRHA